MNSNTSSGLSKSVSKGEVEKIKVDDGEEKYELTKQPETTTTVVTLSSDFLKSCVGITGLYFPCKGLQKWQ